MSLYSFAAANFTTVDDRKRRPAIDSGQLLRTLVLFIAFVIALAALAQQTSVAQPGHDPDQVETLSGRL